jgi:hypothetical protein
MDLLPPPRYHDAAIARVARADRPCGSRSDLKRSMAFARRDRSRLGSRQVFSTLRSAAARWTLSSGGSPDSGRTEESTACCNVAKQGRIEASKNGGPLGEAKPLRLTKRIPATAKGRMAGPSRCADDLRLREASFRSRFPPMIHFAFLRSQAFIWAISFS